MTDITNSNKTQKIITSNFDNVFSKWKMYIQMSNVIPILRRYFVMNAFDGILTALGIIIGSFILFLSNPEKVTQATIVIPGIATTLAISVSGIMGAHLAETAERRKAKIELNKEMLICIEEDDITLKEEDYYPTVEIDENFTKLNGYELEPIEVDPITRSFSSDESNPNCDENKDEEKSDGDKAEHFASTILSLTDGISPGIGSLVGLIPFFFAEPTLPIFIISFILEVIILFALGAYLAKISQDSVIKYGIQMVIAGVATCIISFLLSPPTRGN